MNKLYISDLDGTLIQDDVTLSTYARTTLNRLLENPNFNFTIATARSYSSAKYILRDLKLKLPIMVSNGAYIADYQTGKRSYVSGLPKAIHRPLYELIQSYDCDPIISTHQNDEDKLYFLEVNNDGMQWYWNERVKEKDDRVQKDFNLKQIFDEPVMGFTIINKYEVIMSLYEAIKKEYGNQVVIHYYENPYHGGWYWLAVQNATKQRGILEFCKQYNFDKEAITVFGDNVNDIPMFEIAKHKIAVENAKPILKEMATEVIQSNTLDGVVKYILEDFENEK